MMNRVRTFATRTATRFTQLRYEGGASMVEYALLIGLIAMVAFVAVFVLGQVLSSEYDTISDSVANFRG